MRAFALAAALAAPLALAQSGGDDQDYGAIISSALSQERSAASVLATASDTAAAQSSILSDITKSFNPEQQSIFASVTSQIGTDPAALATATGSGASSAIASISSQASNAISSASSTGSRGASSAANMASSAASTGTSAAAAPTNVAAAGLLGVAGVFGAAALML